MRLTGGLSAIIAFLRAGYPAGTPATGYVPLLAMLRRRVTDNEIIAITRKLIARHVGQSTQPISEWKSPASPTRCPRWTTLRVSSTGLPRSEGRAITAVPCRSNHQPLERFGPLRGFSWSVTAPPCGHRRRSGCGRAGGRGGRGKSRGAGQRPHARAAVYRRGVRLRSPASSRRPREVLGREECWAEAAAIRRRTHLSTACAVAAALSG